MYTGVGANRFFGSCVTSASNSKIEAVAVYKGYFGSYAETVHAATVLIYNNHSIDPINFNWNHAIILLNDDVLIEFMVILEFMDNEKSFLEK